MKWPKKQQESGLTTAGSFVQQHKDGRHVISSDQQRHQQPYSLRGGEGRGGDQYVKPLKNFFDSKQHVYNKVCKIVAKIKYFCLKRRSSITRFVTIK